MTRYIFVNVIANGQVDFKSPYTAAHQPSIKECFMMLTDETDDRPGDLRVITEISEPSAAALNWYSRWIGEGAIVVGHSVEFHHGYLRAAMIPLGIDPHDGRTRTICTMLGLTGHVPKRNGRKGWPSFDECCDFFGITRAGTETAEDNARCLMQVFNGMLKVRDVPEIRTWKER
jgi:DNA polymerase III epsilon subunit-like protein